MDDFTVCPICSNKLRSKHDLSIKLGGKHFTASERTCTLGMNHTLQVTAVPDGQVLRLKVSLNEIYTKFVEIDFISNKSQILCFKNSKLFAIPIDKLLIADFPSLEKLRRKVDLYIALS